LDRVKELVLSEGLSLEEAEYQNAHELELLKDTKMIEYVNELQHEADETRAEAEALNKELRLLRAKTKQLEKELEERKIFDSSIDEKIVSCYDENGEFKKVEFNVPTWEEMENHKGKS
jgi:septal ring factor EnvC (AmiA/AmiB activator)